MTTAVGLRCRDCAQVRPPVTYQTDSGIVARALGAGLVAAVVIGAAWGVLMEAGLGPRTPYDWSFWFALLLGFGVAECVSLAANRKRGSSSRTRRRSSPERSSARGLSTGCSGCSSSPRRNTSAAAPGCS
jgi:F0F1-type ATP synthase assembly protein I